MSRRKAEEIREVVRRNYSGLARSSASGRSCCSSSCCGPHDGPSVDQMTVSLGYSLQDLDLVPEGSNMGLGCGNPLGIASLKAGETVLDIGSGAGFDAFLAARVVGETGLVIGVDATPEMVQRARRLARENQYANVEFREGEMEDLPVEDGTVDVILSNCVINLSTEKQRVFFEAFRVLRPGGRLAISDVVAIDELPAPVTDDLTLYASCVAGACTVDELVALLTQAGFVEIDVRTRPESRTAIREWAPESRAENLVVSAFIQAVKPI